MLLVVFSIQILKPFKYYCGGSNLCYRPKERDGHLLNEQFQDALQSSQMNNRLGDGD